MQPRELLDYLTAHSLVEISAAMTYPLKISMTSTRYMNFDVAADDERRLFVKRTQSAAFAPFLAREAAVYQTLRNSGSSPGIQDFLPAMLLYDEQEDVLVLEKVGSNVNLEQHIARHDEFPPGNVADLGRFLGMLHGDPALTTEASRHLPSPLPWVFSIVSPDRATFARFSSASREVVAMLQAQPSICAGLQSVAAKWTSGSLIHFDLKWANCLFGSQSNDDPQDTASLDSVDLKIIDWEFAGFGDPRWDVGSVLCSFVRTWIGSIPLSGSGEPDKYLEYARMPFEKLEPLVMVFLHSYQRGVEVSPDFMLTAAQFAGARLIQSAYEAAQTFNQITAEIICVMQVGEHLLTQPRQALLSLLPSQTC